MMLFDKLRYAALTLCLALGVDQAEAAEPSPLGFPNWYAPKGYLTELSTSLKAAQAEQRSVSIIQLGDSHIQAGYATRPLRQALQQRYGDAGRGWIGWYRLYGSNAPRDYSVTSLGLPWSGETVLRSELTRPIGLGGYSLSAPAGRSFTISISSLGRPFRQLVVLRSALSYPLVGTGQSGAQRGRFAIGSYVADTLSWSTPIMDTSLSPQLSEGDEAVYAGCALLSGKGGALVSDIGINGAAYRHYLAADYAEQLAQLRPELLILSLGTNDTYSTKANVEEALAQARSFVQLVRELLPKTKILLTTPPPSYFRSASVSYVYTGKRKKRRRRRVTTTVYSYNTKAREFAAALMRLAEEEGIAAFDLHSAMGGEQGIKSWIADGLLLGDRVHYAQEGYERQGQLLTEALLAQLEPKP